jgi:hypothetical protein
VRDRVADVVNVRGGSAVAREEVGCKRGRRVRGGVEGRARPGDI